MFPEKPVREIKPFAWRQAGLLGSQKGEVGLNKQILLYFNKLLDGKANISSLNERVIEELMVELDKINPIKNYGYWLTLARINELALVCAGNYADNCEFSLVGDLLANPRLTLVHLFGSNQAVIKKRHSPLSKQFHQVAYDLPRAWQWLTRETLLEIKKEALLPEIRKRLENSSQIFPEYLDSVEQRKRCMTDLIGFFASAGISDNVVLHAWLKKASREDRKLLESRLCRFNFEKFYEMGRHFREWAQTPLSSRKISIVDGFKSSGLMS